ncbi:MAG: hypothetical protein KC613_02465 [Myxococcales bacterium]|nr:hypothetical protein [Myxococcales bacterium]MCB9524661.1 hypothetical protein [Myxococcales bacterium]
MRHPAVAFALALAVGLPAPALAFGLGYGFAVHQAEFTRKHQSGKSPVRVQYPVHRITLIDTTGALASVIASARYDYKQEVSQYSITTTETWSAEYTPMSEGVRVRLAYAWSGGERDTQVRGEPLRSLDTEFSEFQFTVGGLLNLAPMYVDLDMIDIVLRDLSNDEVVLDRALWNFDLEVGVIKGPLRFGGRVEVDLVAAVDALFDDAPYGYSYGLAANWDYYPLIVTAQWATYQHHNGDYGGRFDRVNGRMLSLGATAEW